MKRVVLGVLVGSVALLAGCGGGGGGGGSGGGATGAPPALSLQAPVPGALVHDGAVSFLASYSGGGIDPSTFEVRLDGTSLPRTAGWTVLPSGASGTITGIADGTHELAVSVRGSGGTATTRVDFDVATGGGVTRVTGALLDPDGDVPIEGASVYLEEEASIVALTDAGGRYVLDGVQPGAGLHVVFDPTGLALTDPSGLPFGYPLYKRPVDVVAGVENRLDPCYLPKLHTSVSFAELAANGIFDCTTRCFLQPYDLTGPLDPSTGDPLHPELDGVVLTIPQWTYVDLKDGSDPCLASMTIAPVDPDKAPSNLPPEVDPSILITVQPTGMKFRQSPGGVLASLPISFPNEDGIAPGNDLVLFSVDHETGEFVPMGTLEADPADPTRLITTAGGLQGGSWHCPCAPGVPCDPFVDGDVGGSCSAVPMEYVTNPTVDVESGLVRERFDLPGLRVMDEPWGLGLVWDSGTVVDELVVRLDGTVDVRAAVPPRVQAKASLDGIPVGAPYTFDTSGFDEGATTAFSVPVPIDVSGFSSGLYRYDVELTSVYPASTATTRTTGSLAVERRPDGAFGRGWALVGDDRLIEGQGGRLLLQRAGAPDTVFEPDLSGQRGLRMRLVEYTGDMDGDMATLYAGRPSVSFEVHRAGQPPQIVTDVVIPSLALELTSGAWLIHAGEDGVWQSPHPSAPVGDDVGYRPVSGADRIGAVFEGWLEVPAAGTASFAVVIDDAFVLEVDGQIIGTRTGLSNSITVPCTPIDLLQGLVPIRAAFNDKTNGARIQLFAADGAGFTAGIVPPEAFFLNGTVDYGDFVRGTRGDFSEVERLPAGYRRDLPDGGVELFDVAGRISERADRRGRSTKYVRDASGRLDAIVDPAGRTTTLARQGGRVTAVTDPAGRTTRFGYTGKDLTSAQDPGGATWAWEYDARGLLEARTDPDGRRNRHEYDARGRFERTLYPDGTSREVEPSTCLLLAAIGAPGAGGPLAPPLTDDIAATVRDELGGETTLQRRAGVPNVELRRSAQPLDALGRLRITEEYVHDATRLPLEVTVHETGPGGASPALVARTRWAWDPVRGLPLVRWEHGLGLVADRLTRFEWDPDRAWLAKVTEVDGAGTLARSTSFERDDVGNVERVIPPTPAGPTTYAYDAALGYVLASVTDPTGVTTSLGHGHASGCATSITVDGKTTSYQLDAAGGVRFVTRADGGVTEYRRDAMGRLTTVVDALGGTTRYVRSPAGLLRRVEDAKQPAPGVNAFTHDARGRLETWTDPLGAVQRWTYDAAGRVVRIVDRNGVAIDTTYDATGRPVAMEWRADPAQVDPDEVTTMAWGPLDRPGSIETENTTTLLGYTPLGDLLVEEQRFGGHPAFQIVHGTDGLGRREYTVSQIGGNLVQTVLYDWDDGDRLTGMQATLGSTWSGAFGFSHDAAGRRTGVTRPDGLATSWTLDPGTGMALGVETLLGGTTLMADGLVRDVVEDVQSVTEVRSLLAPPTVTIDYDHDLLSRLESSTSTVVGLTAGYGPFDGAGNRRADTWTYDAADRLRADDRFDYDYDANGNLVLRRDRSGTLPDRAFEWSLRGQLLRVVDGGVETGAYAYDGLGRRVYARGVTSSGAEETRFLYHDEDVAGTAWGGQVRRIVAHGPGVDEPLGWVDLLASPPTFVHAIADVRGSVVQLADAGGPLEERRFDAFGNFVDGEPTDGLVEYGYAGREYDVPTGLYFNRARYYDASTGRFLGRDAKGMLWFGSNEPRLLNPYSYAVGAPLRHSDPTGLEPTGLGVERCFDPRSLKRTNDCLEKIGLAPMDRLNHWLWRFLDPISRGLNRNPRLTYSCLKIVGAALEVIQFLADPTLLQRCDDPHEVCFEHCPPEQEGCGHLYD